MVVARASIPDALNRMAVATFSFVRLGRHERDGRFRFALLIATLLSFGVYKLWLIGTERLGELMLSVVFDASIWIGAWLLAELIAASRARLAERIANLWFYPFVHLSGALVFAHTWFYDAAIERRLTALDVTLAGVRAFFFETLPARGYLAAGLLLVGMHLGAWFANLVLLRPRPWQALVFALPALLFGALGSAYAPRTPSVLFDTGKELWDLATLPRLKPEPFAASATLVRGFDKSAGALPSGTPRFNKVIVLVMETMTAEQLAREGKQLAAHSFFRAQSAHLHRYVRYFPNNQDSRTGMLNMLASRVIPYEAYSDEGVEGYAEVARQESLADRFRALGYQTAFAVSQEQVEEIVTDLRWDERLHLTQADIDKAKSDLLCFAPDEWENGCEDLAVLPKLVNFVADHERAFVYQEFIWGHAYEYNAASGKTNTVYYSGYVDALIDALRARGLAEQTLIAITSDHGFRDKSRQGELAVLQIPLLFYAPGYAAEDDGRLLTHVDFKDLLFAELLGRPDLVAPSEWALIIGPTGSHMVTALSAQGDFVLLRQRGAANQLLVQRSGGKRSLTPDQLLYAFERYRSSFDRRLRSPVH